jgi:hypothetical protein
MNEIVPERDNGYSGLIQSIGQLLGNARAQIAANVNTVMVQTYWHIGKYIVEYQQKGNSRAGYGDELLLKLSKDLRQLYGAGINRNNLQYMRKLYMTFPNCTTLSCKLSWSHYQEILKADDELEISFYVKECENSRWSVRELRRQMKSMLFHRLALSKNKAKVLELAEKGQQIQQPEDILKDPYVLEFTGIPQKDDYMESDLVVSRRSKAALQTCVERNSRYVRISPLKDHSANENSSMLIRALRGLPCSSIAYDNGIENVLHQKVNDALGCVSYFCGPYHR